jgi:FHS family L-fucose permease-like MFS transporter
MAENVPCLFRDLRQFCLSNEDAVKARRAGGKRGGSMTNAATSANSRSGAQGGYGFALSVLASLFFMWGFITVLDDILVPHLKAIFDLDYFQSMLVQFAWYIAYFLMSIPSAYLLRRIGYKKSLVTGLVVMAAGAAGFVPASQFAVFPLFLAALFVLASGITLLQVAANPYVAVIGPPETAPARLNLVQAMNTLGDTVAPLFGGWLILMRSTSGTMQSSHILTQAEKLADARSVQLPYFGIALVLGLLAAAFALLKLPDIGGNMGGAGQKWAGLWKHKNLVYGIPGIFLYLIAEICVGSLFISFAMRPDIGNITAAQASHYLTFLWGGMMVGRFAGSGLMTFVKAEVMLAAAAIGAFALLLIVVFGTGPLAMWALVLVGLFHSIMFPTIFTLGIRGLGPLTEKGSGLLIMAIAGGAIATAQGAVADHFGLQPSFVLPAICELYILWYALRGSRVTHAEAPEPLSS